MPVYLDTRGNSVLSVAICDRCSRKFPYGELMPDPNFPGMRVCKDDVDNFDPWRLPAIKTENISLRFPRPDVSVALPDNEINTEDNNAIFIEGVPPYSGAQGDLATGSTVTSGNVPHPAVPQPPAVPGNRPIVLGVKPGAVSSSGGTSITIEGLYLTGATAVVVGGTNVTSFTITNSNNITLIAPAHAAGFVTVTVTTPYGTGNGVNLFQYT
jgi:hypothetical protein